MVAQIPSYYVWMVFILPYVGAVLMPLVSRAKAIRTYVAVLFSLLSAIFALLLFVPVLQGQTIHVYDSIIPASIPWLPELGINVGVLSDPYTIIIANVIGWVSFLIMVYSMDYMKGDPGLGRYWFFMNFFIGNMQLIVLSDNLLSLFVGWEGVGLCSYALIGYYFKDEKADWVGTPGQTVLGEEQAYSPSHAGMKAFVMTRIGDVAMLAGMLILFLYANTFSFHQLAGSSQWATKLANAGLLVPVALLLFGGAVGKSAQFPLQEWLPDAMAGPAPVSALIHAATMVKAGVVLVARIGPIFYFALSADPGLIRPFFLTVAWIGAFTAVLAASQALVGFELKKILAYSTVSQVGYMMMALGLTALSPSFTQGLSASLFHLISHAIFKAALFMAAGVLIHTAHSKYINEMGGMRGDLKITFAVFLVAVASLSGIPPLSGFWSKDAVLATAWSSGQYALFFVGVATAGMTAFYSFRMLGIIFFGKKSPHLEESEKEGHHVHEVSPLGWVPYGILGIGTLLIGVLAPILNIGGALESASNAYLSSLIPSTSLGAAGGASPGFEVAPAGITLVLVIVGVFAAWSIYVAGRYSPTRFVGPTGFMHGLYKFLENRWYINAIYYRVFVDPAISASRWLQNYFEIGGLERVNAAGAAFGYLLSRAVNWIDVEVVDGFANGVAGAGQSFSRAARRIQSGVTEQYILVFSLGLLVLLVGLVLAMGVHII